ncbi:hypothetical protein ACMA5I_06545 [Paracoccaceae bacterium GXU_MW_L88]
MPQGITITPQDVREFANLPSEVPDTLLTKHIRIAARDLASRSGVMVPPVEAEETWQEALTVRALASVYPWLNTFALDGAAKIGRLEGSVQYRFLDADDTDARVQVLMDRFHELAGEIASASNDDDDPTPRFGGLTMIAI